jgi:DNA-binding LacI/PurR family transcriptional regulator
MGRAAGELLLERIKTRDSSDDAERAPRHVVLPYTLRKRETT